MRTGLGVVSMVLVGCVSSERGLVQGRVAAPREALVEISFVPEPELRPFLARREALKARLGQLHAERLEAEQEWRRVTDDSLFRRLAMIRNPPPLTELQVQKRQLAQRSAAVRSRARELRECLEATRQEASLPAPEPAVTVSASREGRFEAALPPGRYGVAARTRGADGRWHTLLGWAEVDAGSVGEVQLDDTQLALDE